MTPPLCSTSKRAVTAFHPSPNEKEAAQHLFNKGALHTILLCYSSLADLLRLTTHTADTDQLGVLSPSAQALAREFC